MSTSTSLMKCLRVVCVAQLLLSITGQPVGQQQAAEVLARGNFQAVEVQAHPHIQAEEHAELASFAQSDASEAEQDEEMEGASTGYRKQLMRSDRNTTSIMADTPALPTMIGGEPSITSGMSGGVAIGACKNFMKTSGREVSVSCPAPLKMVGCNCRDKSGENTGGCGTRFSMGETCNAFSGIDRNITAYVRCCHMDWGSNFTIETSDKSGGEDGNGATAGCHAGTTLLGCGCLPDDAPNRGCKHSIIMGNGHCVATNLLGHPAGVKAQALCAILPNSSDWESVAISEHKVDESTNLTCTKPYPDLQMMSCSCGSGTGRCWGGKVIAHRCECNGERCFATARCANIPVPPRDCIWHPWSDWSDCTVSCGKGKTTRIREIAMLEDRGEACVGPTNTTIECTGDATIRECNYKKKEIVTSGGGAGFGGLILLCCCVGIGAGIKEKCMKALGKGEEDWGGEHSYGEYGAQDQGGYGGYGGAEGAAAWVPTGEGEAAAW